MRLLRLLCVAFLSVSGIMAQDRTSPSLAEGDLAARTRAALEELTRLETTARADREAFRQNEADLESTITEFRKPLPERPTPLEEFSDYRPEAIRAEAAKADAYREAWDHRRARYDSAAALVQRLGELGDTLRKTHEHLLRRVAEMRAIVIEAQRKIERRELKVEDLDLPEGIASVAEWVNRSADLASRRGELLEDVDLLLQRFDTARRDFEALPPDDPEEARIAKRIEVSLATLAEASAVSEEQRARFEQSPAEAVPSEVSKAIDEWKARDSALATAAAGFTEAHDRLNEILQEEAALEVPRREDIPEGEGFKEVREARRDAELASRMVGYYTKALELLEKSNTGRRELLAEVATATQRHAQYTSQSARLIVWIGHATKLEQDGALTDWKRPEGATEQNVWDSWRARQVAELDRLDVAREVGDSVVSDDAIASAKAKIEEERQNEKRAAAQLETELSYAEFVSRMADLTDAQLIALLAPDGEIAQRLEALDADRKTIEEVIAVTAEKCLKIVREIQANENPYSQSALRDAASDLPTIRDELQKLKPGRPYPDDTRALKPVERPSPLSVRDALDDTQSNSAAEVANKESEYLADEQQFARFFLEYFLNLDVSLRELSQAVAERRDLEAQLEAKLDEIVREEKRRYAAARQLRRHVDQGSLDASSVPQDLDKWLGRSPILQASENLRAARRDNATFHTRATYEIERLKELTAGIRWMRIRSDSANTRVSLSGRPVAHLTAALTPINELNDVDSQNLQYEARAAQSNEEPVLQGLLERFTDADDRRQFEDPLATYYLELANAKRVTKDLRAAEAAYGQMADNCLAEKEQLEPLRPDFERTTALRLSDYQAACYAAAAVVHPSTRARLEEAYRTKYGRDLPYRLNLKEGDIELAAELLFSSQARLRGAWSISRDADRLLSKVGLEQEIGWYRAQIARIRTLLDVERSRHDDLRKRVEGLRTTYQDLLETNALHGLSITLVIPLVAFLVVRALKRVSGRFEKRVMQKQDEESSDRQRRLQTVSKTSTAAIAVLVWTIAIVYVFARLGLDITPIVASASVVGLAVAFGAQTLIKDFFTGFFILLENQFTIGDVVTLNTITGTVENISLRITVLRDLKGVVHYIPNGSIGQVSNKTQGWSRVVTEISVSYKEDPDHVTRVLEEVLQEMARDERWRRDIIEEPVVAGVEMITDRSVDIRIMIKTRPGQQWAVAREARRRIKLRFDELGIEIPYPHRVIRHVYEEGGQPGSAPEPPPEH